MLLAVNCLELVQVIRRRRRRRLMAQMVGAFTQPGP